MFYIVLWLRKAGAFIQLFSSSFLVRSCHFISIPLRIFTSSFSFLPIFFVFFLFLIIVHIIFLFDSVVDLYISLLFFIYDFEVRVMNAM